MGMPMHVSPALESLLFLPSFGLTIGWDHGVDLFWLGILEDNSRGRLPVSMEEPD
jgi:hypothetical protein